MSRRRRRSARLGITVLACSPAALLLAWPQALGAQRAPVIAQLLAFRAPLALALALLAVIAVLIALRKRSSVAAGLAIILTATSLTNGAVLVARGSGSTLPEGDLTVLVWNTQGGATSPDDVARLALSVQADVVSLPEMDEDAAAEVVRLLAQQGRAMTPATTRVIDGSEEPSWIPTSLLVAERMGAYRRDETAGSTPGLPSGLWRPVDGTGPAIAAAHPAPPLSESIDDWRAGLRWIAEQCDSLGPDVIVAGDLNATVDHLSGLGTGSGLVGACADASVQAGAGAAGTWPATVPALLAAPIDHILVGSAWTVRGVRVFDGRGGSDHRPIVAVLTRR